MKYRFERDGEDIEIEVVPSADGYVLYGPDRKPVRVRITTREDGQQRITTPWGDVDVVSARRGSEIYAHAGGRRLSARAERARPSGAGAGGGSAAGLVRAPMAGKLLHLHVRVGDHVKVSQPLAVIEAMKMENELVAPQSGVVVELGPEPPATVEKGALIVKLGAG